MLNKMPNGYDVTVAAFRRFERRSGVKLFEALADVIKEAGEAVDGTSLAKAVFTSSESLAAFVYECGFDATQRAETAFEDWLNEVTVADLFEQYDKAISALFVFSPSPRTGTEVELKTGKETAQEMPSTP